MSTEDETYWNKALTQVANEQIEHKFTKPFLRPAYDCSLEEENPCTPCAPASLQSICKQYLHKNIKITCKVNRFITYSDYMYIARSILETDINPKNTENRADNK